MWWWLTVIWLELKPSPAEVEASNCGQGVCGGGRASIFGAARPFARPFAKAIGSVWRSRYFDQYGCDLSVLLLTERDYGCAMGADA